MHCHRNPNGAGIADCYPDEKVVMRITRLDEDTGAFRAESIKRHPRRSVR